MQFKLEFKIPPFPATIEPASTLFFAGSCFSENIASRFERLRFRLASNTHGILYNPMSIADSITDCLTQKRFEDSDLFFANDCWNSFQHHSRFSHPDKNSCLREINDSIVEGTNTLKETDFLFITFGSAFQYKHIATSAAVANCHKIPQKEFEKILLTKEEIVERYTALINELKALNKQLNIFFTVSPVRYIRDGITENNLSKSILIQSVHEIIKNNTDCFYFPAYEIVNDELRDYRFFEADMVHPNQLAIDYVWERLSESLFPETTKKYAATVEQILRAAEHRPFNPESLSHKKFKENNMKLIDEAAQVYPHANLANLKKHFS